MLIRNIYMVYIVSSIIILYDDISCYGTGIDIPFLSHTSNPISFMMIVEFFIIRESYIRNPLEGLLPLAWSPAFACWPVACWWRCETKREEQKFGNKFCSVFDDLKKGRKVTRVLPNFHRKRCLLQPGWLSFSCSCCVV